MNSQRIIIQDQVEVNEEIYHLACQQNDLNTLKILVQSSKNRSETHDADEEEGIQLVSYKTVLQENLFVTKNGFIAEWLNEKSKLGNYLRSLYKEVYGFDFDFKTPSELESPTHHGTLSESAVVKIVFELQSRDKGYLDQHNLMNIQLKWNKNAKMLMQSNKNSFNNTEKVKAFLKAAVRNSNDEMVEFLCNQYPNMIFESRDLVDIFKGALENGKESTLNLLLRGLPKIKHLDEKVIKELYTTSTPHICQLLMKEFDFLSNIDFIHQLLKDAIDQQDNEAIIHHFNSILTPDQINIDILQNLLFLAVSKNFLFAIDFLIGHCQGTKNLSETTVNQLFMESMKHQGTSSMHSLTKNFPCLSKSEDIIKSQAKIAIQQEDPKKLAFFIQEFECIRDNKTPFFNLLKDCNTALLMNAIGMLSKSVEGHSIEVPAKKIFEEKLSNKDYNGCKTLLEKVPGIALKLTCERNEVFLENEWLLSKVRDKLRLHPELYQHDVWAHFTVKGFQEALKESDIARAHSILETFPHLQKYKFLFKDVSVKSKLQIIKTHPDKFQDEILRKDVVEVIQDIVNQNMFEDVETFLEYFPDLIIHCDFKTVSMTLKNFSHRFGTQLMKKDLVQAFRDSDIHQMSLYISNIKILHQNPLAEEMWQFALQNCKIDAIYFLLKEVRVHSDSKDELIKYLLENDLHKTDTIHQPLANQINANVQSSSPLNLSIKAGSLELVTILLINGAISSIRDLEVAARKGHSSIVDLLIRNNDSLRLNLQSSLMKAVTFGHPTVVKILLDHGAKKELKDSKNKTPKEKVIELLKKEEDEEKRQKFRQVIEILEQGQHF